MERKPYETSRDILELRSLVMNMRKKQQKILTTKKMSGMRWYGTKQLQEIERLEWEVAAEADAIWVLRGGMAERGVNHPDAIFARDFEVEVEEQQQEEESEDEEIAQMLRSLTLRGGAESPWPSEMCTSPEPTQLSTSPGPSQLRTPPGPRPTVILFWSLQLT